MSEKQSVGPVIRTKAPALTFISIIPNFAGKEEYLAQLISERYERTGITDYAMSYPLNPQGDDPLKKPRIQAASFRKLKALLKGKPVRLGILFQSLLGHGGYWNMAHQCGLKGVKAATFDGKATHRFCPNEKNFLKYIDAAVSLLAAEKPVFCLTDDDLRMFRNTCFCKHHIAEVSKKMGMKLTRKQVVDAVRTAAVDVSDYEFPRLRKIAKPELADKIAKAWIETQVEGVDLLCKTARAALDRVDPSIPCGVCMVCRPEYTETQATILAGRNKPLVRINNGAYLEGAIKDFAYCMSRTGLQQVLYRGKGWTLLDESDTCPHNRFSKTATTMHAHIATGIAMGMDGGKLWLDQGAFPAHEVSRAYEDILGKYQGFYRELHALAADWKMEGLVTRISPLNQGVQSTADWNSMCFNCMGIPSFYGDLKDKGITLLCGQQVKFWTDAQLKTILSGKAIVDGAAALELTKRGFSKLIGVKAENKNCLANVEECQLTGVRSGFPASVNGAPFFTALPKAEVIGKVRYSQFKGDDDKVVMPGTVYFRNAEGGEIITTAMDVENWHFMYVQNPGRKITYLAWLEKLGGISPVIPAAQHVKLFAAKLPSGEKALTVVNLSYDPLPVTFLMKKAPARVLELQPAGDWKAVKCSFKSGVLTLDRTMSPAEVAVFKIAK